MKSPVFNGLVLFTAVMAAFLAIRELPSRRAMTPLLAWLAYRPVELPPANSPLRLAGAWEMEAADPRLGGISALALNGGRFLAVTDRGALLSFDPPGAVAPAIRLSDLRAGPGPFGRKWSRDAESLARDPGGRGWWVGYEQNHSLWLYDLSFSFSLTSVALAGTGWRSNRGAEGLLAGADHLLVTAENGRDAIRIQATRSDQLPLAAGAEVADAAMAPDGSAWMLLRSKGMGGIRQEIAPLIPTGSGYKAGTRWPVPKGRFDNYEGLAIEARSDGAWRFWLITDDGHRIFARTMLVALDYLPAGHDKSPAQGAGPSNKPAATAG